MEKTSGIFRASGGIAAFTILTAVSGLLVDVVLAARFGLGESTDAFYAAYTVPFFLANTAFVLGQATLVPIFSRCPDDGSLSGFLNSYVNFGALAGGVLTAASYLMSGPVVSLVAPGMDEAAASVAGSLLAVLSVSIVLSFVSETLRAYLYSRGRYVFAASSNFIRNAVALACIAFLHGRYGIMSAAYGFAAGYAAQFISLAVRVYSEDGVRYGLRIDMGAHRFSESSRIGAIQAGGFAILQCETFAERIIGSFLPPGSITALSYASRIIFMAVETLAGSVATATLPALSKSLGGGDLSRTRDLLGRTFRLVLVMFLPLTALIAAMSVPVVTVLYGRGAFGQSDVELTAWVFMLFATSLVFQGYNRLIHNYLFAALKPRGSLLLFTVLSVVAVGFDIAFVDTLGISAIPAGYIAGSAVACVVGYRVFIRGLGMQSSKEFWTYAAKAGLVSVVFGALCRLSYGALASVTVSVTRWSPHISLAGAVLLSGAAAWTLGVMLKVKELDELFGHITGRFRSST